MKSLKKSLEFPLNIIYIVFKNFSKNFLEYIRMQNENIDRKYLNNMRKNKFLQVKKSILELEKDFTELKDR